MDQIKGYAGLNGASWICLLNQLGITRALIGGELTPSKIRKEDCSSLPRAD
jgi:hypothetical protein